MNIEELKIEVVTSALRYQQRVDDGGLVLPLLDRLQADARELRKAMESARPPKPEKGQVWCKSTDPHSKWKISTIAYNGETGESAVVYISITGNVISFRLIDNFLKNFKFIE